MHEICEGKNPFLSFQNYPSENEFFDRKII
jgi:hypothetical protein